MSMRARVEAYLAMRRSLGFRLEVEGRMLLNFADSLDRSGQTTVTVAAALAWATESEAVSAAHQARRLAVVRLFARHLATLDPSCQIPPPDLLPARSVRPTPYIYSGEEIAALVHAAGTIASPMHAATTQAVIGLIAASGLRLGEALGLDRADIDLDAAHLTVTGKHEQPRLIPLHATTVAMLADYAARRDRHCSAPATEGFFATATGRRPRQGGIRESFAKLLIAAGIRPRPGQRRPRIHDLRHTFAVNTLIEWYESGVDVAARMPVLSTFLGHTGPEATYWYLQATPELLALAAQRLEHCREPTP
jgi:integrase/recombinase XerD